MKRYLIILVLAALAIGIGSGCKSMTNVREIDLSITGLEMEFYPSHPSQEDEGWFGNYQYITNRIQHAPTPVSFPVFMEMDQK